MATAKKSTSTKKTTARKTTATRKAAPKKVATRKTAPKKVAAKRASKKAEDYKSFKLTSDIPPIMSFKITRQTVYWVIIMAFIIFFQLWIIKLQIEVAQIVNTQQDQIMQDL